MWEEKLVLDYCEARQFETFITCLKPCTATPEFACFSIPRFQGSFSDSYGSNIRWIRFDLIRPEPYRRRSAAVLCSLISVRIFSRSVHTLVQGGMDISRLHAQWSV